MANSRRKCKLCEIYSDAATGIKTPAGFFCSHAHAIEFAIAKADKARKLQLAKSRLRLDAQAKEARKVERQRKMDVKPLRYWHHRARKACHEYIRARDADLPCISCGCVDTPQWDAGHYRPSGINSALRYDERQIRKQCVRCNRHLSGSLTSYRVGLVAILGEDAVTELDNNHETKRYTREELEGIEAEYKAKLKALRMEREGVSKA